MGPHEVAAALRKIADSLDTIVADDVRDLFVSLDIQPHPRLADDLTTHIVDMIGQQVLGHAGKRRTMGDGVVHYQVQGIVNGIKVAAYGAVTR
jgi:hypothetical protein